DAMVFPFLNDEQIRKNEGLFLPFDEPQELLVKKLESALLPLKAAAIRDPKSLDLSPILSRLNLRLEKQVIANDSGVTYAGTVFPVDASEYPLEAKDYRPWTISIAPSVGVRGAALHLMVCSRTVAFYPRGKSFPENLRDLRPASLCHIKELFSPMRPIPMFKGPEDSLAYRSEPLIEYEKERLAQAMKARPDPECQRPE